MTTSARSMSASESEGEVERSTVSKKTKKRKTTGRARSWTDDETRCLIEAWMKYRDMERTVGSKHLFREKLVNHLIKNGYTGWDGDQVRRRMDNLKKEFRANINPGTGSARKEWKFRKELCEVLRNDFYTPDPQKIRETATPVPPVSPDASNAPNAQFLIQTPLARLLTQSLLNLSRQ